MRLRVTTGEIAVIVGGISSWSGQLKRNGVYGDSLRHARGIELNQQLFSGSEARVRLRIE
jgi:hypothetical protein